MKKGTPFLFFSYPMISVLFFLTILTVGCEYRQGELNGDVFIITKGGENVKLGLVTVQAIPEDKMKEFITKKNSESKTEIEKLQLDLNKAIIESENAEKERKSAANEIDRRFNIKNPYSTRKQHEDFVEASEIYVKKLLIALNKEKELINLKNKQKFYKSAAFYFNGLPEAIASAKTNAEGRFTLSIQRDKRVALAAHATRQVFDNIEEYYWLIWVSLDEKPSGKIILSNDNLTGVGAKDSVITTI